MSIPVPRVEDLDFDEECHVKTFIETLHQELFDEGEKNKMLESIDNMHG